MESRRGQAFHSFVQAQLFSKAFLSCQPLGLFLQDHRPGVGQGVHRVAHAVNQPAAIGGLPPEDLLQVGFHLPFVLPVSHVGHQVVHHPPYLVVGAAVLKAL